MDFEDGPPTLSGAGAPDPKELGTCRIEVRLASGAGTQLYRAVDLELGRSVVVKVIQQSDDDPSAAGRMLGMAEKLKGLVAANVVQVLRTGVQGDWPYIVFELIDGEDLDRAVRRERALVPAAGARAVLDAATGLNAALTRGLIHGDVRPRHLMRTRGTTKVTGFSLSPIYLTAQGRRLKGHPGYIAPEVAQGGPPDHRSDIYSLGATLFEIVTGRPPYGSGGADALVACHVHEPFPAMGSVKNVRVPDELEGFLERMVAKQPSKRFQTYVELLQAGAAILPSLRKLLPTEPAIIVEDGRKIGLRMNIPEGDTLLGRTPGEGFQLDDARCSRRHAMIRRSGDYIEVEDLGSRNGIKVNGADVRSRQLFPGDRIEIGDTILRIEGNAPAQALLPMMPAASPVRGAFGDVEISHAPGKQAGVEALSRTDGAGPTGDTPGPAAAERLKLLSRLAPLLAQRQGKEDITREVLSALGDAVAADERCLVRVHAGTPVFEASTSQEAQVLSCILPAIERALPGQLSLATAVKVGRDDRWSVLLGPVLMKGQVVMLIAVVKKLGSFDAEALTLVEACCDLLTMRAEASPARE